MTHTPGYTREARIMGKKVGKGDFFFGERCFSTVYSPFPLLQHHPDSGRRPSREALLEIGCWPGWTIGLVHLAGGFLSHRNPRARSYQGTRAECPGRI